MTLIGQTVFLVEDEWLLADMLKDALEEEGARILGPAATLDQAMAMLLTPEYPPSVATLNYNLDGGTSLPIADELNRRAIPFLFLTGAHDLGLPDRHASRMVLHKPFTVTQIVRALASTIEDAA